LIISFSACIAFVDASLRIALRFTLSGDRIASLEAIADPEQIGELDVEVLER
jgi:RNA polymerase sigma-70 factor (ECF subfamily)